MKLPTFAYFGACPRCHKFTEFVNIHKAHFGVCRAHRAYWPIGRNLVSSWIHEDDTMWRMNAELLESFDEVKPAHWAWERNFKRLPMWWLKDWARVIWWQCVGKWLHRCRTRRPAARTSDDELDRMPF